MKGIILTAGSGRRMRPVTDSTHKTLVEIGGRTVIQWILDSLIENGVKDIAIVTGYMADELKTYLGATYPSLPIEYIHNERYDSTNNIYSMAMALERFSIDSDVILIECDLIFEPSLIRRLLDSNNANVALVDRYRSGMDGTVVKLANGVITEVITPDRQDADFSYADKYKTLNIYRFSKEFCAGSFKRMLTYYASVISDNAYYELVLGIIVYLQHETVHAEIVQGEQWAELDDPNDIHVARFLFDHGTRKETLDRSFGGYWNYDILDFSFIRNMRFPTGSVVSKIKNNLQALLSNYGSCQAILDEKLAYYLLCSPSRLLALNGASQAYPWMRTFFAGGSALIPSPAFGEYARAFPGARTYLDAPGLDMDVVAGEARGHDVLVFVNPNNPTGSTLATASIWDFAAANPAKTVIVDESFLDFSDQPSLLPLLEAAPLSNVILIKSLGKSLGVPGLRLGFVYGEHSGFMAFARSEAPIWGLNALAEHFLEIILKYRNEIQASFRQSVQDRERFAAALERLPLVRRVHPSGGNFLLVSLNCPRAMGRPLAEALLQRHGILVKDVSGRFQRDEAVFRLGVRLPEENDRLVDNLARHHAWDAST